MNLHEPATGVARYPDTGDPIEAVPAGAIAHAHIGARHFTARRTMCICADQPTVDGHWQTIKLNFSISADQRGEQTWPDRENIEPYEHGFAGLGFSTVGSRALIVNATRRARQYGDMQGYQRHGAEDYVRNGQRGYSMAHDGCGRFACDCPINIVDLAHGWEEEH